MEINKDSNEKELNQEKMLFKQEFDADISFSDITRNAKGEIVTIKVTVKDKDNQKTYPVYEITKNKGDNRPINPFTVAIEKEEGSDKNLITFNDPVNISVLNGAPEIKADTIYINKKDVSAKQNNKSFSKLHANVPTNTSITERVNQVNNSPLRIVEVKSEKKLEKDDLVKVLSDQGFDFNKAYLSVDGKEVTLEDLKTAVADVMALKSFSVGTAPNEKGAEKYGSKAYNGFIVITTQTKP